MNQLCQQRLHSCRLSQRGMLEGVLSSPSLKPQSQGPRAHTPIPLACGCYLLGRKAKKTYENLLAGLQERCPRQCSRLLSGFGFRVASCCSMATSSAAVPRYAVLSPTHKGEQLQHSIVSHCLELAVCEEALQCRGCMKRPHS